MKVKVQFHGILVDWMGGSRTEMEKMLKSYYQFRGWDWKTGRPTKEKLLELGLNQVAAEMYP